MTTELQEELMQMDPKIRSETQQQTEQLTLDDITTLMEHDGYQRVKGRVRQRNWSEHR